MEEFDKKFDKGVFEYIQTEKTAYETQGVPLASNWEWKMFDHIDKSFQLKNSQFTKGVNDFNRPYKNIMIPILNVSYRSEGFDVKNIEAFVNDSDQYYKSFVVNKFHPKWARRNHIDTFIDDTVESYVDYGLAISKDLNGVRPECVPLQRIAFCDQTDVLSGPICEKHQYSIDALLDMKGRWYDDEIDMAIVQAEAKKNISLAQKDVSTPGKYVEVYELEGVFPETWLNKEGEEEYTDEQNYVRQVHIVTFYKQANGEKAGICLFKSKRKKSIYKAIKRDNIFGRACGRGAIEELFHPQIWTNYTEIQMKEMLDKGAMMIMQTTDKELAQRNKVSDLSKGEIMYVKDGASLSRVDMQVPNVGAFNNFTTLWEQNARAIGSASDPQLGINPASGTPLGTTEIVTSQGIGIHEYRQGKIAEYMYEIYQDWILKYLVEDINKGDKWIEELSLKELREVSEAVAINTTNQQIINMVLSNEMVTPEEQDLMIQLTKENWRKKGQKQFIETVENEFRDIPIDVEMNVAGKQKDMQMIATKLNNIFRFVFANPQALANEGLSDLFNQILEASGLSPINFSSDQFVQQQQQPQQMQQQPVEQPL